MLYQLRSFFSYWLEAVDEHSLHSPFYYNLYTRVISNDNNQMQNTFIEEVRNVLLYDDKVIEFKDFGSGSNGSGTVKRKVNEIARKSLTPQHFARLYQRLADAIKGKKIIELGTSFGITTMYLAHVKDSTVFSFEGTPEIATIALRNFRYSDVNNVELIIGNIEETLPPFLSLLHSVDLVVMDANHRYDATMKYFKWISQAVHPGSILIMDDIHYSEEMERAWEEIKNKEGVHGSIDLFRCGLVFFDPSLNKQHVVLQLN
ncbi:MAG TPA: class I SAM-dependent methyltransferase [Cyclobacteriaceae bacterium]|nr:class I SAM-dependent methyltransferase [Cyclobacteriaceae bacterium]